MRKDRRKNRLGAWCFWRKTRLAEGGRAASSLIGFAGVLLALWFAGIGAWAQEPAGQPQLPEVPVDEAVPSEPEAATDRNTFEFELPAEDGGGRVVAAADHAILQRDGAYVLDGNVEVFYQDITVRADRISLDTATQIVIASGKVVFDQGPQRMVGSDLEFNLESKLGRFQNVRGSVSSDYYFTGDVVEMLADDRVLIEHARFSSCQGDTPAWSFRARKVNAKVDGYAKMYGTSFRAKKLPLFYFPYLLWPTTTARTSGLLVPKPGFSSRRGASLGLAYFQTFGRSYDATISTDVYFGGAPAGAAGSGDYFALGTEFRYRPGEGTKGVLEAFAVRDPELDANRWKLTYDHESKDLPGGFRGVVHVEDVSDFDYFRDYERRGDRNSQRQLYSYGFVTRNHGPHSINVKFDSRETFFDPDQIVVLRQLPEIEYKLRSTKIASSPFYFELGSSLHYVDVDRSARLQGRWARGDLYPQVTIPIRAVPWLSFSVTAGARYTWYSDSLFLNSDAGRSASDSDLRGESLSRFLPTLSAEMVGPSFSKVYGGEGKGKVKHVVEPRLTYGFLDEYDDEDRVPVFDEVDRFDRLQGVAGRHVVRASLINRLLSKPAGEDAIAREVLSLTLFRDISLAEPLQISADRRESSKEGPITAELRYNPSRRTTLKSEVQYDSLFSEISRTDLSATIGLGKVSNVGLRWTTRIDPELAITRSNQARLTARFPLVPRRLNFDASINYDLNRQLFQVQRYVLDFKGSCYGLSLDFSDLQTGNRRDTIYRFLVTLKNVGTFLDINGGTSETL